MSKSLKSSVSALERRIAETEKIATSFREKAAHRANAEERADDLSKAAALSNAVDDMKEILANMKKKAGLL